MRNRSNIFMKKTEQKPLIPSYEEETAENITIEINEPKHNFIIVYDTIYKNTDLNGYEIALLIYLLSRAPTYKPNKNGLMHALQFGEDIYFRTTKSLQEKGYLKIERNGNGYKYIVNQSPTLSDKQLTYEYLAHNETFNAPLWNTLLNNRKISYETYNKLWENMQRIARINWIKKD